MNTRYPRHGRARRVTTRAVILIAAPAAAYCLVASGHSGEQLELGSLQATHSTHSPRPAHCGDSEVRGDAHALPGQAIRVLPDGGAVFTVRARANYVCGTDGRWIKTGKPVR
jgi:hypothetical protein